ncbi:hypothetical protein I3843_08G063900 [Carya illinoinensis]|nr:hypothetical protein I3843_08G063900 [Carya illinoinensis]
MARTHVMLSFLAWQLILLSAKPYLSDAAGGSWQLLQKSIGITAMHMQLLNNDRVIIFDRTDFGNSNLTLPGALFVQTDVWCSSGAVMPDGRLIQTGGFNTSGERRVRTFVPCTGCDWTETPNGLAASRWYATNHILPDGRQIIIGGRKQFNYEFYPKSRGAPNLYSLPFLSQTNDPNIENNLYPFVFLNVDGNLFIFANNRSILLDYAANKVVKTYPEIPGGDPRCYPSTGSAVLLPLKNLQATSVEAEVLVCGGAPKGAYTEARTGIKITDPNPQWVMETMPTARIMGDMTLLPNGNLGSRFELQNLSTIPRMYHSSAILLRDGRVLVGGSNPHSGYVFTNVLYPTELTLEAFYPPYLEAQFSNLRPQIVSPLSQTKLNPGRKLAVRFSVAGALDQNQVSVTVVSPSFTTHSFSMNQRLLVLGAETVTSLGNSTYEVQVTTPAGSGYLAPSGYYLLFLVHQEIPSEGIWVQLQ